MILIADAGSTKTEWAFCTSAKDFTKVETQGINPCHQTDGQIVEILENELLPQVEGVDLKSVSQVFFYGAGCATEAICNEMCRILSVKFTDAAIEVDSDLVGAARALCQRSEGIACILGTGSNSCLYDGNKIVDHIPSLGYILGDEGSSAALGKRLIGDCLKRQLPEKVSREFMARYDLTMEKIIENVYRKPVASRYIASFAPFLEDFRNVPEIHRLLVDCFTDFMKKNVKNYRKPWLKVNFVGSLALRFQDELAEAAESIGMSTGKIVARPMDSLISYHLG